MRWIPDVVDARARRTSARVETRDGGDDGYDALLLALGARPQPALPGALTVRRPARRARRRGGDRARWRPAGAASSSSPPPGTAWTLPLYELALLTAEHGRRRGLELALELVTREAAPLGVFGATASAAVARRLADAGVRLRTGTFATEVADGTLWLELEGPLDADLVIALPRLTGPRARRAAARRATASCPSTATAACAASTASGPWAT